MYNFVYNIVVLFSGISFIIYGTLILTTTHMTLEFERYQMSKYRALTGILELTAGVALIIGYFHFPILITIVSSCLTLLMLSGTIVRIRVGDTLLETFPAIFFMFLNLYIVIYQNVFLQR